MSINRLYTEVDFTPSWYHAARKRRLIAVRQSALLMVLVALTAVLVMRTFTAREGLKQYHAALVQQLHSTERKITEVVKLERQRSELTRELAIHRRLHQPITYSEITGTLAKLMPEAIALRGIELRNDEKTITLKAEAVEDASHAGRGAKAARPRTVKRPLIAVEVEGLAPSDVEVANFIGSVAGHRLFENVKMVFARQAVRDGLVTREFKISMEVPLDCRYEPVKAGEVADAK